MHPKLLNQVWVCRGTGVINRGAQLIISTLKAASGVHLWVNLVVSLSIGVVCFCDRGKSERGVCVCVCVETDCFVQLYFLSGASSLYYLSLSQGELVHVSVGGGVGGACSWWGFFLFCFFLLFLLAPPAIYSGCSEVPRQAGWEVGCTHYLPPPSACSLCLHRYLLPLACLPPPLPPFLYVLLSRCQPSSQEPFVPESPPIYSSCPFNLFIYFLTWWMQLSPRWENCDIIGH